MNRSLLCNQSMVRAISDIQRCKRNGGVCVLNCERTSERKSCISKRLVISNFQAGFFPGSAGWRDCQYVVGWSVMPNTSVRLCRQYSLLGPSRTSGDYVTSIRPAGDSFLPPQALRPPPRLGEIAADVSGSGVGGGGGGGCRIGQPASGPGLH